MGQNGSILQNFDCGIIYHYCRWTDPPEFNSISRDVVVVEGDPSVILEYVADSVQSCLFVFNSLTDPPELNSVSSDVVVVEGDHSITLECIADGEPTPNITWTKVYANDSDSGVLGTGNQFVLENNRNNSERYRCTAHNGIGTAPNRTVKVEVNCKKIIIYYTYSWFLFFI